MEDYTAPSFSLGLDLDFDADPQNQPEPPQLQSSIPHQAPEILIDLSSQSAEEDEEFQPETLKQLNEEFVFESPPLKRLKRGPPKHVSSIEKKEPVLLTPRFNDDDIEDFEEEEPPREVEHSPEQNHYICSKPIFTFGHNVLNTQTSNPKTFKSTPASKKSISTNSDPTENRQVFPNLTITPIRKFQLVDSDSDSFSPEARYDNANKVNPLGYNISKPSQSGTKNQEKRPASPKALQNDDLWKNFASDDRFGAKYVMPGKGKKVVEEAAVVSGNWVSTKSFTGVPKDAGKRRVQAEVSSGGQWYTGQDGKRVYVSKSGEKMTGQNAYKQYRKESGKGFKRPKKGTI